MLLSSQRLIYPAIGASLIAALTQFTIPLGPVPFSLQNLAIGLVATLFKPREAFLATTLYILLGALGLPVFAGGAGGIHILFGPTAGFLWAYLLYSLVVSYLTSKNKTFLNIFISNILGDGFVFLGGVLGLVFLAKMPLDKAFTVGVLPFLLPDLFKIVGLSFLTHVLFNRLKHFDYFKN